VLFAVLFIHKVFDLFTKWKSPNWVDRYILKGSLLLIFIDLTYMAIDLALMGAVENLERYWIMTVVCIAISYIIT
jgi:hypothetical protein